MSNRSSLLLPSLRVVFFASALGFTSAVQAMPPRPPAQNWSWRLPLVRRILGYPHSPTETHVRSTPSAQGRRAAQLHTEAVTAEPVRTEKRLHDLRERAWALSRHSTASIKTNVEILATELGDAHALLNKQPSYDEIRLTAHHLMEVPHGLEGNTWPALHSYRSPQSAPLHLDTLYNLAAESAALTADLILGNERATTGPYDEAELMLIAERHAHEGRLASAVRALETASNLYRKAKKPELASITDTKAAQVRIVMWSAPGRN